MIRFSCHCGHVFELDESEAGGLVQCNRCGRLNDVPGLGDLASIADDGTYKVEDVPTRPQGMADMTYVYQRGTVDADGNEIDLRITRADIEAIGGEPIPLNSAAPPREHAPKYDPETGELIRPIEVKRTEEEMVDPASIPIAKATVNYASAGTVKPLSWWRIFFQLFMPLNLAVIFAILCVHVLIMPLFVVVMAGIYFLAAAVPVAYCLLFAHFGNVVEDIGPNQRDELPRPLRDLGWYEDIWSPLVGVMGSLVLCYGPAALVFLAHPSKTVMFAMLAVLGGIGTFLLPAVLLTLQTSGTSLNLRPDRLLAVINACGAGYFIAVVTWVISAVAYAWGWLGTNFAIIKAYGHDPGLPDWLVRWDITLPMLALGVFLMHYFCWGLGMLYRAHYSQFPWVLQHHEPTRMKDAVAGKTHPAARALRPGARTILPGQQRQAK